MRVESPVSLLVPILALSCASTTVAFPWRGGPPSPAPPSVGHAEVVTLNKGYRRATSQVLVREVRRPTRANLDYAAYHANFMNADPEPEGRAAVAGKAPETRNAFGGSLAPDTLTGSITATPLTEDERRHPLAFAPLVELLASRHIAGAEILEEAGARIRAEDFGLGGGPQVTRTVAALVYIHDPRNPNESRESRHPRAGQPPEIWIEIEIAPWFKGFSAAPDDDGDGTPQLYGRVPAPALGAKAADLARFIRDEYAARVLSAPEVKAWAHQLASYWYPSYNTDLVTLTGGAWPDGETEPAIRAELGGLQIDNPTVVMRGKPQGKPVYNVLVVKGLAPASASSAAVGNKTALAGPALPSTRPTPDPRPVADVIRAELAAHGGSWPRWMGTDDLAPFHAALRRRLKAMPAAVKATAGDDGFLFFRQSLTYVLGGDLGKQRREKNPLPAIVQFKKVLDEQGVDFLFVPVPTKVEIFPDKLAGLEGARVKGQVVNPFERKLLLDLSESGVEVVDLLPLFLAERLRVDPKAEPLYQAQDTHWTSRGLELAAQAIAARVKRYPWYPALAAARRSYGVKDATVTRHGDLHSRLPEAQKAGYAPEQIIGHQVIAADGTLYEDDADSPVVLLGDSFTGVFQLMDCEHAGVSAHLARQLGYPVDLVMSYGGGPNVRQKLLRRGAAALATKKLVIWMMTARDLFDFWEGWQPLPRP